MTTPLRRRLALLVLLAYTALLLIAAIPDEVAPDAVEPVTHGARAVFDHTHIRPFAFVFVGRRRHMKRRTLILTLHARLPDGTLERVFAAPEAPLSGYQWVQRPQDTFALKTANFTLVNRLMRMVTDAGRRRQIRRLRHSRKLARLGRFGCASPYAADGRAEQIYLTAYYEGIDYRNGRIHAHTNVVQIYDCERERTVVTAPWPAATLDPDGMPLPDLDTPDPLFAPPPPATPEPLGPVRTIEPTPDEVTPRPGLGTRPRLRSAPTRFRKIPKQFPQPSDRLLDAPPRPAEFRKPQRYRPRPQATP